MSVIGEGGYGCVFYPPLNCENRPPTDKSMISKLQSVRDSEYEYKQLQKLKGICRKYIKNCDEHLIVEAQMCEPHLTQKIIDENECELFSKIKKRIGKASRKSTLGTGKKTRRNKKRYKKYSEREGRISKDFNIINMKYSGINLHKFILKNVDFKNPKTFIYINNAIIDLYVEAVMVLNKNKIYHNDIKTSNILIDDKGQIRLIDWGVMNEIIFRPRFDFNRPYMFCLMSDEFIEKLNENMPITQEVAERILTEYLPTVNYLENADNMMKLMYPMDKSEYKLNGTIHPLLYYSFVDMCGTFKSYKDWLEIYVHNLDICGVAIMYSDILCAIYIHNANFPKLIEGLYYIFEKYVLKGYVKINSNEFIDDLKKLNLLLV